MFDIAVRIVLAVFVVIGVYSIVYAFLFSWKYKGDKTFAEWDVVLRREENVSTEMILLGLEAAAERSNVPVKKITVHTGPLSVLDDDVCRRFAERHPLFTFDRNVSRET